MTVKAARNLAQVNLRYLESGFGMAKTIDCLDEPDEALSAAVDWLSAGMPVAIPTETVYGLAADATNPEKVDRFNVFKIHATN
ncbi:MAG: hypothetical protein RIR97_1193 [Pseudomonadota bacterium]